ncbi:MAG: hypothetical protein K6G00_06330, partial [Treponema sp.]|nr:hypothetical protein [Treponema sp.]
MVFEINNKKVFSIGLFFLFLSIASFFLYIYPVRELIIKIGELVVSRPLTHNVWHERIINIHLYLFIWFFIFSIASLLFATFYFNEDKTVDFKFFYPLKVMHEYIKDNKIFFFSLLFIFISISALRFYWASQKECFHEDECWELGMINNNKQGFNSSFDINIPYTGKQIKDSVFFDDPSILDTVKDVSRLLIKDKYSDHGRLFYVLYRLWFMGYSSNDMHQINQKGIRLNYIFFCFSFYFFCLLAYKISKDKVITCCLPIIAFANPVSIGLFTLFRVYVLQEMCFILFTYLSYNLYKLIVNNENNIGTLRNYVLSVVVCTMILNADYFPSL